jgi:hypothetical protein
VEAGAILIFKSGTFVCEAKNYLSPRKRITKIIKYYITFTKTIDRKGGGFSSKSKQINHYIDITQHNANMHSYLNSHSF